MNEITAERIIEKIFKFSKASETEVKLFISEENLTRFSNNIITQNVSSKNMKVGVRIIHNGKTLSTSFNDFSDQNIKKSLNTLFKTLKYQDKDERLLPLASKEKIIDTKNLDNSIVNMDPIQKAKIIKKSVDELKKINATGAGICSNNFDKLIYATSNGFYGEVNNCSFEFSLSARDGDLITREEFKDYKLENFNIEKLTSEAIKKLELLKNKKEIEADKYDIILTPEAFSELLTYMLWFSFSAKSYMEKRTFLIKHLNKKIFPDFFTLYDDPVNDNYPITLFDFEGTKTFKNYLIKNGKCEGLLSNRWLSKQLNIPNTGNAVDIPSQEVYPFYPKVEKGDKSLEQIIKETKKGLFINRFHYLNIIDPMELTVTGMTRDGVYFIENGKIKHATNNLRFTESIIRAFQNLEVLSNKAINTNWFFGFKKVPGAKIKNFNFTSKTDF